MPGCPVTTVFVESMRVPVAPVEMCVMAGRSLPTTRVSLMRAWLLPIPTFELFNTADCGISTPLRGEQLSKIHPSPNWE